MNFKYTIVFIFFSIVGYSQVTISNGNHVLEITGAISTYYNYRDLKDYSENRNKDRFRLRDAQIQLEGRVSDIWEYELQVDFVDLASSATGEIDPENPGLMEARVTYKGLSFVDIEAGYGKLYYSRSSLNPFSFSPYWQRAQIVRGDIFSRRDVGITLKKGLWRQLVNVYAGAYTGLGEISLRGDNDSSGALEYVGRIDFAYPSRYRYREIDDRVTPIPMFQLGLNGRYTDRQLTEGRPFPEGSQGEYGLKMIDGKRYVYGMDFSFQYMGFSGQFEIHQMRGEPLSPSNPLFQGLVPAQTNGYFLAGGWLSQINYFHKPWKSIISLRYEELDLSDLVAGKSQRLCGALAYQIKGFDAMIKAQYFHNLGVQEPIDLLRWNEQIRIGMQFNFK
jgi:hypothetical protein